MSASPILLPNKEPKEISAATTLLPYRKDDPRAKYLGYLCCGFSDEEALFVLSLTYSWLESMRRDDKFTTLELSIPDLRKELGKEYVELDFLRNFRMVMEKDHRVLRAALGMDIDEEGNAVELSFSDQQYLLKLRSAYTPQQLQLLQSVITDEGDGVNFADWVSKNQEVIEMSQTKSIKFKRQDG